MHRRRADQSRAFSLVEMLVVIVILVVLSAIVLPRYLGGGKSAPGKPTPKTALGRTHDVECQSNLRSDRQCIEAERTTDSDNQWPASLESIKGVPAQMRQCPVGHEPYQYDPSTGQLHCPHPGHESY